MGRKNKEPPGFYSYQEAYPIIQKMSDSDLGKYYRAKYEYWIEGVYPDFTGYEKPDVAETMWCLQKGKLDNDRMAYYVTGVKRMYAAWARDHKDASGNAEMNVTDWYIWKKTLLIQKGEPNVYFDVVTEMDLIE